MPVSDSTTRRRGLRGRRRKQEKNERRKKNRNEHRGALFGSGQARHPGSVEFVSQKVGNARRKDSKDETTHADWFDSGSLSQPAAPHMLHHYKGYASYLHPLEELAAPACLPSMAALPRFQINPKQKVQPAALQYNTAMYSK